MSYTSTNRDQARRSDDTAITICVFLIGLALILILVGSVFFDHLPWERLGNLSSAQPLTMWVSVNPPGT